MSSTKKALLTTVAVLAVLTLIAAPASATFPGHNGLIAFQAQTAASVQIYTVRPNGRSLQQITYLSGDALAPAWSSDGRRIVFEHDAPGESPTWRS
jgi:TolB protein